MRFLITKNINEIVLSSHSRVCKTEKFTREHSRFLGSNKFISHFAEGILLDGKAFKYCKVHNIPTAKLSTIDGEYTLYIRFGYSVIDAESDDIIFYAFEDKSPVKRKNDISLVNYLNFHDKLEFALDALENSSGEASQIIDKDFKKLYSVFNSDQVNFPLLNKEQLKLIEIENNNVLVQGVAGSGKTNVCIDKIIYTACRGYSGKTLYTTFSRGLLVDTIQKINVFKDNVRAFVNAYRSNKVFFIDDNKRKAVENHLGLFLNIDVESIPEELERILYYLDNKVDFFLLSDLYPNKENVTLANEDFFVKEFGKMLNTRLSGKFAKVAHLSIEVVYKEIYGMIFGASRHDDYSVISLAEYTELRRDSFSPYICEVIYSLALDYKKFLAQNNAVDYNIISRELIEFQSVSYSLTVIDEVQDLTEINLALLKKMSRRMFCVGDALQMINPSYFSFAYLKRLLYEENSIAVSTLKNNYRNTERITEAINRLSELNISKFGVHNFVLRGESIEQGTKTVTINFTAKKFAELVHKEKLDNFTIVVASVKQKEELRRVLKRQEILTVSEIKGLERDTVLLYNILSDNIDKWNALDRTDINRKKADENSVYRYYFNLLYVGVSRAKYNLFIAEQKHVPLFDDFFNGFFDTLSEQTAIEKLAEIVSKNELDTDELLDRINEFIRFGQFDNARFTANKLEDDSIRRTSLVKIDINEKYIQKGDYKQAGIAFWEAGITDEAKKMFKLSGDDELIQLIDECEGLGEGKLNTDIVRFYPELSGNPVARGIILDTLKRDSKALKSDFVTLKNIFNSSKEKKNGKK